MKKTKANVSVLSNGLKVITEEKDFNKAVIGIWIKTGVANETTSNNGISHFLEHMMFKGTINKTAKQLIDDIEYLGGSTNAYTGENMTAYHVTILNEYWKEAIDFLSDIICNSNFPQEELEKERNVILQELNNSMDDPNSISYYNAFEDFYKDQPMSRKILGTEENINKFTREDLLEYKLKQYTAKNMVISVTGNINHDEISTYCEQKFNSIKPGEDNIIEENNFNAISLSVHTNPKIEQSYIFFARKGLCSRDTDTHLKHVEALYNTILDGGMSCRLFQKVREENGLGYTIGHVSWEFYNTGLLGYCAIVEPKDVDRLVEVCQEVLGSMKTDITETEFQKAINTVLTQIAGHNDTSFGKCESNATCLLLKDEVKDWDEVIEDVKTITIDEVKQFAEKYTGVNNPYTLSITKPE